MHGEIRGIVSSSRIRGQRKMGRGREIYLLDARLRQPQMAAWVKFGLTVANNSAATIRDEVYFSRDSHSQHGLAIAVVHKDGPADIGEEAARSENVLECYGHDRLTLIQSFKRNIQITKIRCRQ